MEIYPIWIPLPDFTLTVPAILNLRDLDSPDFFPDLSVIFFVNPVRSDMGDLADP